MFLVRFTLNLMSDINANDQKLIQKKEVKIPPVSCIVPGTNFTVDWHCKTKPEYIHSFLSHAHTDHIAGIGSFRLPRILHCTPITAKMMLLKYPKLNQCIETHEIGTTFTIEKVKIQVLDANHTPGSAMFLFTLPNGQKVLHTGDFRAEPDVIKFMKPFAPVDHLFIDCTYATAKVKFFTRKECTDFAVRVAQETIDKNGLVLIGTYTLGKEECAISIAKQTGQKIFPCKERQDSIKSLIACKWCSDDIFTFEPDKAKIHLISIQNTTPEYAIDYAQGYCRDNVCCISLSGWNGKFNWQTPQIYQTGSCNCTLFNIPYSDHSSQDELINFVKLMKPRKITPTTSSNPKEIDKINKLFLPYIRKSLNKGFIEFYSKK